MGEPHLPEASTLTLAEALHCVPRVADIYAQGATTSNAGTPRLSRSLLPRFLKDCLRSAMLFGLKEGVHPVEFEVRDPTERLLEAPCRAGFTRLSEYARGSVMGGSSTRRRHRARSQARSRRPRRSLPRNRARRRTRWSWRRVEAATPAREQEGRSLRVLEREARSHVKPEHRETRKVRRESLSFRRHTVG